MKRYVLIYNPVSGHATFRHSLDTIIEAFQRRQTVLVPYRTSPGDDLRMADFIREVNPEGVLAAGGDGTLHEVVNVLMKDKPENIDFYLCKGTDKQKKKVRKMLRRMNRILKGLNRL